MARRNDHTREEIRAMALDAARRLIDEKGLGGLSARAVAGIIGYTPGTLYLVFRNLDDLILNVNAGTLERIAGRLVDACPDAPPRERILAMGRAYVDFVHDEPGPWGALYQHRMDREAVPDWYLTRIERGFAPLEQALAELARTAEPARVALAARTVWGAVNGICGLAATGKLALTSDSPVEALVDSLLRNYLAGWAPESTPGT